MTSFRARSRAVFRRVAAAIVAGCLALPASADRFSDHWHDPADPGWGVAITHQGDILFAVVADYLDSSRDHEMRPLPSWHVMPELRRVGSGNSAKEGLVPPILFQGDVYRTAGPSPVVSPGGTKVTRVGSATFEPSADGLQATLDYTIDGRRITRTLRRMSIAPLPLSGAYLVGLSVIVVMDREGGACHPGLTDRRETWAFEPLAPPKTYRLRRVAADGQVETLEPEVSQAGSAAVATFRSEQGPVVGRWTLRLDHAGPGGLAGVFEIIGDGVVPDCRAAGYFAATRKTIPDLF